MIQEDINWLLSRPPYWEIPAKKTAWKQCPVCNANYCGDGVSLCVECETEQAFKDRK